MWRKVDLHTHTSKDDSPESEFSPSEFVEWALASDVDVVAVSDHDSVVNVGAILVAAEGTALSVVPVLRLIPIVATYSLWRPPTTGIPHCADSWIVSA